MFCTKPQNKDISVESEDKESFRLSTIKQITPHMSDLDKIDMMNHVKT